MKILLIVYFITFSLTATARIDSFIKMSDQDLFTEALNGKVGKCRIFDSRAIGTHFCDYYAKVQDSSGAYQGLPDSYGSGCLVAPSEPKGVGICWGSPNTYDKYNESTTPICTNDYVKNGANMIRIGLIKGLCGVIKDPEVPRKCELKDVDSYDEELPSVVSSIVIDSSASVKLGLKEGYYQLRKFRKNFNKNAKRCLDSGAVVLEVEKKSSTPSPLDKWSFSVSDDSNNYSNNNGLKSLSKDIYGNSLEINVEFRPGVGRLPMCKILKARLNGIKVGLRLKSFSTDEAYDCVNSDSSSDSSSAVCSGPSSEEFAKITAQLDLQSRNFQKERDDFSKAKGKLENEKKQFAEQGEKQKSELNAKLDSQRKDFQKEKESLVRDQKKLSEQVLKLKADLEKAKSENAKLPFRGGVK